eukprot:258051-Rhodomonas_salina.2
MKRRVRRCAEPRRGSWTSCWAASERSGGGERRSAGGGWDLAEVFASNVGSDAFEGEQESSTSADTPSCSSPATISAVAAPMLLPHTPIFVMRGFSSRNLMMHSRPPRSWNPCNHASRQSGTAPSCQREAAAPHTIRKEPCSSCHKVLLTHEHRSPSDMPEPEKSKVKTLMPNGSRRLTASSASVRAPAFP